MTRQLCILLFLIITIRSFCQTSGTPKTDPKISVTELYNTGVKNLNNGMYAQADTLFTLAIQQGDRNKDTYFNRAIARKKLGNTCGYCVDLVCAGDLGDKVANSIFWQSCPKIDSIFDCIKNMRVAIKDTQVYLTRIDSSRGTKHISVLNKKSGLAFRSVQNTNGKVDSSDLYDPVFDLVSIEVPAHFPGGDLELFKFLQKNLRFREYPMQGKVYTTFIIDRDGTVTDVAIHKGVPGGQELNEEALRVIKLMPKWTPGKQNGKAVRMRYILPIHFKTNR